MTGLLLTFLLASPAPATPAPKTPAATVPAPLAKAAARYRALGAFTSAFTQTYVPAGFKRGQSESGTLTVSPPQALRWDYAVPEKKTFVLAGDSSSFYMPAERQLIRKKLDAGERAKLRLLFLAEADGMAADYDVTASAAGADWRLRLRPRAAAEGAEVNQISEISAIELLVDGRTWDVRELAWSDAAGNRTTVTLAAPRPIRAPPAAFFEIAVPRGTEVIEY